MENSQKGIIHLLLPIILIIIAIVIYLVYSGVIKNPLKSLPIIGTKEPTVTVKTAYQNPFDKNSQYVNPFDQSKSPLLNLKK